MEAELTLVHQPVPFAGTIKDGETVKIECLDWYGIPSLSALIRPKYLDHLHEVDRA